MRLFPNDPARAASLVPAAGFATRLVPDIHGTTRVARHSK